MFSCPFTEMLPNKRHTNSLNIFFLIVSLLIICIPFKNNTLTKLKILTLKKGKTILVFWSDCKIKPNGGVVKIFVREVFYKNTKKGLLLFIEYTTILEIILP